MLTAGVLARRVDFLRPPRVGIGGARGSRRASARKACRWVGVRGARAVARERCRGREGAWRASGGVARERWGGGEAWSVRFQPFCRRWRAVSQFHSEDLAPIPGSDTWLRWRALNFPKFASLFFMVGGARSQRSRPGGACRRGHAGDGRVVAHRGVSCRPSAGHAVLMQLLDVPSRSNQESPPLLSVCRVLRAVPGTSVVGGSSTQCADRPLSRACPPSRAKGFI